MQTNKPISYAVKTHESGVANEHITPIQQLRRTIMSCMLWEKTFYEDGTAIEERVNQAARNCRIEDLSKIAIEARISMKLRHAPLMIILAMLKRSGVGSVVSDTIYEVIGRPDELTELLSLYWKDSKKPLSKQLKIGLAKAFTKFSEYQLAKYNRDKAVKLKDVLFMVHAKPLNEAQAETWKKLANNTLESPDTWEVALSAGADKKETFTRLIEENKLGYLALLRNLRNMTQSGVEKALIQKALIEGDASKILPFRFIAAARACPQLEPVLDQKLLGLIEELPSLKGTTIVLVDVSGSMNDSLSDKSDLTRMDAAAALAAIVRSDDLRVFSFSNNIVEVPTRRGMAGVCAVIRSQYHGSTRLRTALDEINKIKYDRLIVITDEQHQGGRISRSSANIASYMINVGTYKNGIGYSDGWTHLDGFSENVLRYIYEIERSI